MFTILTFISTNRGIMTVKERISEFQALKGYNDFAFERAIGKGKGSWHNTSNPSSEFVVSIFTTFPDLSAEYVFRGEGDMLKTAPKTEAVTHEPITEDTAAYYAEVIKVKNERIDQLERELAKLRLNCDQAK